jgi:uncharacterized phage-associated protein
MTLEDATDYIITKVTEGGAQLSLLKLQKLAYYAQAWHLAFFGKQLFDGRFQAWVHGPVSYDLYRRYRDTKSLYSDVSSTDVRTSFDLNSLPLEERLHIDAVLEVYAKYSGTQLEELTHNEEPWIAARGDCRPSERCTNHLDESLMASYYGSRTQQTKA